MTQARQPSSILEAGRTDLGLVQRRTPALLRGCRPRQWAKNLLVLAAPALGAGGIDGHVVAGALVALVTFCAVSSAVYLVNDVRDVEADRCHPTKRLRPIACGDLRPEVAVSAAAAFVVFALAVAWWWEPGLAAVLGAYLAIQVAYSFFLKHQPGFDLLAIASGFLLRVVAGGAAAGVELSLPFLLVVGFGSLFMIAGKRHSEMATLGASAGTRRSLAGYSLAWLRLTWIGCAVLAVGAYVAAAAGFATVGSVPAWLALASVPPFLAGVLRYAGHIRAGGAGSPEDVLFGDRVLALIGLSWLLPVLLAVAAA